MSLLKDAVNFYIDNERADVLSKRCNAIVGNIRHYAGEILMKLEPIYGNADIHDSQEDDLLGKEFNQWWGREWQRIKKTLMCGTPKAYKDAPKPMR